MNNEVKVSLNVTLPGRVLLSQEEALTLESQKKGTGFDSFSMRVEERNEKGKVEKAYTIRVNTRRNRTVKQIVNLTEEAYNSMISNDPPYFIKAKEWYKMSKKQRLEKHLERISQSLNGVDFSYIIFDK